MYPGESEKLKYIPNISMTNTSKPSSKIIVVYTTTISSTKNIIHNSLSTSSLPFRGNKFILPKIQDITKTTNALPKVVVCNSSNISEVIKLSKKLISNETNILNDKCVINTTKIPATLATSSNNTNNFSSGINTSIPSTSVDICCPSKTNNTTKSILSSILSTGILNSHQTTIKKENSPEVIDLTESPEKNMPNRSSASSFNLLHQTKYTLTCNPNSSYVPIAKKVTIPVYQSNGSISHMVTSDSTVQSEKLINFKTLISEDHSYALKRPVNLVMLKSENSSKVKDSSIFEKAETPKVISHSCREQTNTKSNIKRERTNTNSVLKPINKSMQYLPSNEQKPKLPPVNYEFLLKNQILQCLKSDNASATKQEFYQRNNSHKSKRLKTNSSIKFPSSSVTETKNNQVTLSNDSDSTSDSGESEDDAFMRLMEPEVMLYEGKECFTFGKEGYLKLVPSSESAHPPTNLSAQEKNHCKQCNCSEFIDLTEPPTKVIPTYIKRITLPKKKISNQQKKQNNKFPKKNQTTPVIGPSIVKRKFVWRGREMASGLLQSCFIWLDKLNNSVIVNGTVDLSKTSLEELFIFDKLNPSNIVSQSFVPKNTVIGELVHENIEPSENNETVKSNSKLRYSPVNQYSKTNKKNQANKLADVMRLLETKRNALEKLRHKNIKKTTELITN